MEMEYWLQGLAVSIVADLLRRTSPKETSHEVQMKVLYWRSKGAISIKADHLQRTSTKEIRGVVLKLAVRHQRTLTEATLLDEWMKKVYWRRQLQVCGC